MRPRPLAHARYVLVPFFGLTRRDAYSFMSVAVDFTVTQVGQRWRARSASQAVLPALAGVAA